MPRTARHTRKKGIATNTPKYNTRRKTLNTKESQYNFFTNTSHYVGFNKVSQENTFYYVSPFQLNTVVLQYLIDNRKVKLVRIPDGRYMLTFINFPGLILEKSKYIKKTQYESGKFVNVYELNNQTENPRILSLEENMKNLLSTNSTFRIPAYLENNDKEVFITQNIDYIKDLIDTLKNILTGQRSKNQCDLSDKLSDFHIIDIMYDVPDVGKVIIVGYPNSQIMSQYLNHSELKDYMIGNQPDMEYLLFELYNLLLVREDKKPLNNINEILNGDYFDTSFFCMKQILRDYFTISHNNNNITFNNKLKLILEELKKKRNEYAKKIFGRKDFRISYIFHFFTEYIDNEGIIQLRPMIFNLRELEKQYLPVLERTNILIKTEIPKIFGILKEGESEYDNFYSYYTYSDLFHIKTEFVNYSGGTFSLYFNEYQRSITLDELIHSLSIKSDDFWKQVKLYYKIRNFKIEKNDDNNDDNDNDNDDNDDDDDDDNNDNKRKKEEKFKIIMSKKKIKHTKENLFDTKTIIIKCIMNAAKGLSIYFKRDEKFYYINLLPRLHSNSINYDKLDLDNQSNIIFKCEKDNELSFINCDDAIYYSRIHPIILNNVTKEDIKTKSLNFFRITWNFGIFKQKIQNYNFINKTVHDYFSKEINNNKGIKFSNYFKFGLYNLFLVTRQSDEIATSDYPSILDQRILDPKSTEDNQILNKIWYFEKIKLEVNGIKYLLLIQKVKKNPTFKIFKYVVWIYQTNNDFTLDINGNKLRNIYNISDFKTLNTIINEIKKNKKLFPDGIRNYKEFPNPENIFVNKAIGFEVDVLHLQIFADQVIDNYYSILYGRLMNLGSENRLLNIKHALNLLKVYDGYFKDMTDEDSKQRIFNMYLPFSI